ncbi:MAG: hypothetical protein DRI57_11510 [Deltaproteobacteria bacterium]|nr:MAG: hypothetical protein DRI57_11510 [Deltaproteobacteria bacterium]
MRPIPFGIFLAYSDSLLNLFLWKNQIRAVSQVFLKIRFPKNSGVPGLFIRVCKYCAERYWHEAIFLNGFRKFGYL